MVQSDRAAAFGWQSAEFPERRAGEINELTLSTYFLACLQTYILACLTLVLSGFVLYVGIDWVIGCVGVVWFCALCWDL